MLLIKKSICYVYCLCDRRVTAALKWVSKFRDFFFRWFFQQICFQNKNIPSACWKKFWKKRSSWLDALKGRLLWDFLCPFLGVSLISIFIRSMTFVGGGAITTDVETQKGFWIWKFVYWNLLLLYLSNDRLKKIINQKRKLQN